MLLQVALLMMGLSSQGSCVVGSACTLTGTVEYIRLGDPGVVLVDAKNGCVPLALSRRQLEKLQRLDRRRVVVSGIARRSVELAPDAISVVLRGRTVPISSCGESASFLEVESFKTRR